MQQMIDDILRAMKTGQHAEALRLSRVLQQSFPSEEGVLSLLAVSEQNAGDLGTARDILLRLTSEHAQTWQHWNNLGNVERLLGDLPAAGKAYAAALAIHPDSARLRANLGLLQLNLGEFAQAREHLLAACELPGAESGMRVWAAVACQAAADDEGARRLVDGWRQWPPVSEEAMLELGWLLILLHDLAAGELILSTEFQDSSLRMRALARRVLALERLNRVDEAADLTRRMVDPAQIADRQARMETLQALASIAMRQKRFEAAREALEKSLLLDQPARYQRPLLFALAKACDALGDADASMAALARAHAQDVSAQIIEDGARLRGTGLLALADPRLAMGGPAYGLLEDAPAESESPVFVVGFPRSGTTLLEQMLGAHAAFVTADEQPMVQRMLDALREQGIDYPNGLGSVSASGREELRHRYWQESRRTVQLQPGQRLVDKHPLNFLALPLIRYVFPNAPIIFCRRHPCDSILSSYMQDFRDPRLAAECASLDRLAHLFVRLMQRWEQDRQKFPSKILICRHEDLVSDTGQALRRIGDFLDLADTSAMLNFSEHAQARGFIGTPSYAQVVQAINPDAAGRWRRYAQHMGAILPTLQPIMDDWGYDA